MARVDFPLWLRLTHVFNILFITLMMRSGIQILFSLPKLYWKDDAIPGQEWLKFTRKELPKDRIWVSLDEEAAGAGLLGRFRRRREESKQPGCGAGPAVRFYRGPGREAEKGIDKEDSRWLTQRRPARPRPRKRRWLSS